MKILYLVNNAGFFCSHRLPIALAARQLGHEVALLSGQAGSATLERQAVAQLRDVALQHYVVAFGSGSLSPWAELRGLLEATRILWRWQPDLVHCVSPKGVLYGGLLARLTRRPALVLAVSGMGSLFTGQGSALSRFARRAYLRLARIGFGHPNCHVIVQNHDDQQLVVGEGLTRADQISLIPGSGVPLEHYTGLPWANRSDLVVLPARLLHDKGVAEFVDAARRLRVAGCRWRFALVGTADYRNPSAVPLEQVQAWVDEGCIEWWGHCDDMPAVYGQARIVCLPSHREGMPKALLEAAAAGCAVVTTDAVGCREAILPGITGDLVPVRDAAALAGTLQRLIGDDKRQAAYGEAGRRLARERFGLDAVVATTLGLYARLVPASVAPTTATPTGTAAG